MKKAILGKKIGMTQLFRADGTMIPVTVVEAGPCPVVQKKTVAKEGYDAVQVGFCELREKLANKPLKGHCAKAGVKAMRYLRELKLDDSHSYRVAGSLGACTYPGEVFRTKRLPGHMGSETVTVQNLEVARVDAARNLLLIKGAIPGAKGTMVTVKSTVK